jgi:ribosomal protein S18 acetylase RimI-like enzyme
MEPLRFRFAQTDDVPALLALVHSAYRGEASRAGWTTEADLLDGQRTDVRELNALVRGAGTRILLAFDAGGLLVGSVMLAQAEDSVVNVGMLAVNPQLQKRGVGRALLHELEAAVQREQLGTRLQMTVIVQRSELIAWYERRGYHDTGETRPFPYGDQRFGLPRRPDLEFTVLEKRLSK